MTSPRLLVFAAMALGFASFPATGSAALSQDEQTTPTPVGYGVDGQGRPLWTSDGVLSPGESVNVNFPLRDTGSPEPYPDDGTGFLYPQGSNGVFVSVSPSSANPFHRNSGSGLVEATTPYTLAVSQNLQCGTRVPLRLNVAGPSMPAGGQDFQYSLPTGGVGAFHRTPSTDVGNVIYDGQTKESKVTVAHGTSLTKGIRVHIDHLEHQYSTYWLKLTLVSPSGKEAVLINQVGATQGTGATPNKQFDNVTFSMNPVNGEEPMYSADAAQADFQDTVIEPQDSFEVFDGEPLSGVWKLRVSDITAPLESRRLQGRSPSGDEMAEIGDWQIDTAGPVCSSSPFTTPVGPDAWFGDEPLILDPAGGTIDAGASVDPSNGGSITSYQWDLDGNLGTGTDGFETSTGSSTVTVPGPLPQGKRTIRLRVVDNDGNVSAVVSREVIISKRPVIDSITLNPTQILAGTPVTITATATDEDLPQNASLNYQWDLDDDGVFTDASGPSIQKTWVESGTQIVRLKVTDDVGAYTTKNVLVRVSNTAPTAAFSVGSSPVIAGDEISFNGSGSSDVDGTIVSYSWDLDGDGSFGDVLSDQPVAKWTYTTPGTRFVRLRVTDNTGGTDETETMIDVTGRPVPLATASPTSPLKGETVTFNGSQSHDTDPTGSIVKYEWDLDGNNSFEISGATAVTAQRSYPNAGTIVAKLRVTDNSGATAMALIPIVVRDPAAPSTGGGSTGGGSTGGGSTGGDTTGGGSTGGGSTGGGANSGSGPGGAPNPPGLTNAPLGVSPITLPGDPFDPANGDDIGDIAQSESGFIAKLSASSKAKGRKVYKKGIRVKFTANDANKVVLKVMITKKDAKKVKLKIKKTTMLGYGKLTMDEAGTEKLTIKFKKKYQRYVKRSKKTRVTFRAVVKGKTDGSQLVLAKTVYLVK